MQTEIEKLLDDNNNDNVVFYSNNQKLEFEQVALIPMDGINYVILHPLFGDYGDDDVIVYSVKYNDKEYELLEITNEETLSKIEEIYLDMGGRND